MQKIDFSNYLFRCSGLHHLMTDPKTKAARELGELSESTKTYLKAIFIKEVYGREKPEIGTGATRKGTMVESDSLDLLTAVTGEVYFKNPNMLQNEFIKGTPDVISKNDEVIDIKSNWDIWTFSAIDEKKARDSYYYQVLGYMYLTKKTKSRLSFCLVNTPEEIIARELYKLQWTVTDLASSGPEAEAMEQKIRKNYIFDDIDPKERLKQFYFDYSQDDVDQLVSKIQRAREYLQGLSL